MFLTKDLNNEQISDALNLTGVEHLKQKSLSNLSGGEFQRVLIARAIAKKPELLVLDEPVQGVDFKGEVDIYELIKKISEDLRCGILLISHDLHMVMSATDHVICLMDTCVVLANHTLLLKTKSIKNYLETVHQRSLLYMSINTIILILKMEQ